MQSHPIRKFYYVSLALLKWYIIMLHCEIAKMSGVPHVRHAEGSRFEHNPKESIIGSDSGSEHGIEDMYKGTKVRK